MTDKSYAYDDQGIDVYDGPSVVRRNVPSDLISKKYRRPMYIIKLDQTINCYLLFRSHQLESYNLKTFDHMAP